MIYIFIILLCLGIIYLVAMPPAKENLMITNIKEQLTVIDPTFSNLDIRESTSSYTEDKSIIYLCLRDENGNAYPINTILYVALHEIAHLLNKQDYGHTPAFYNIFNKLLCKATDIGIYDPNKPHVAQYCGVDITGIRAPVCNA